jgi:ribonuclease-3
MDKKFRADPYNINNILINEIDINNIMKDLNITDFKINNISYYRTAFIHKSYCKLKDYDNYKYPGGNCLELQDKSYEQMEFLGDAILGSIVSSYIYERFHLIYDEDEGFLTKLKIRIVCGENLALFSKDIKLNKYIIISKHIQDNCSGRDNSNILEDVFEAFIGAIYLDKGYSYAERFVINVIEKYCDLTNIMLKDTNYKDQISRYFQQNFGIYPCYDTTKDDNNMFTSKLINSESDKIISVGNGNTKKRAEQDASKKALVHYNVIT